MSFESETRIDASESELLAIVEASPAAVARHDKAGWLALFSREAVVEDPVGTPPHRKGAHSRAGHDDRDDLDRFYETFIAANEIHFEVHRDIVCGWDVVRDVVIHIRMPSGFEVEVPTYLLYEVMREDGELRIARMAAHWEAGRIMMQTLRSGIAGLRGSMGAGWRLFAEQGVGASIAYTAGTLRNVGRPGLECVERFRNALGRSDAHSLDAAFVDDRAAIEIPARHRMSAKQCIETIALAGPETLRFDEIRLAGRTATCRFGMSGGRGESASGANSGIVLFRFDAQAPRLREVRFFW
jgi:ketosteroid isomerase-like protein